MVADVADNQFVTGVLGQMIQFAGDTGVMGGNLVGDPQGDDAGASATQGASVGIGAIAHFLGGGQNAGARLLGNLRVTGQRQGDELPGDAQLLGDMFLSDHGGGNYEG